MARAQLIGFSLGIVVQENFGIGCGPVGSRVAQSVVVDLLANSRQAARISATASTRSDCARRYSNLGCWIRRTECVGSPELVQLHEGFSLLGLKRSVQTYGARARRVTLRRKNADSPSARRLSAGDNVAHWVAHDLGSGSAAARLVSPLQGWPG